MLYLRKFEDLPDYVDYYNDDIVSPNVSVVKYDEAKYYIGCASGNMSQYTTLNIYEESSSGVTEQYTLTSVTYSTGSSVSYGAWSDGVRSVSIVGTSTSSVSFTFAIESREINFNCVSGGPVTYNQNYGFTWTGGNKFYMLDGRGDEVNMPKFYKIQQAN